MMEFMALVISAFKGLENSEKIDKAEYMKSVIDIMLDISLKLDDCKSNITHRSKNKC